jgi:ribose transport system permease protein
VTSGIDLSVGMVMVLANCLASTIVVGSTLESAAGVVAVLAVGALCGAINGVIVIFGRLQPIVTTIATGSIYYGIALALRPVPGGDVEATIADAVTGKLFDTVPASFALLLVLVLVVWLPFRRSVVGRGAYAIGSSEVAAYMSGVPIKRATFVAYTLSGLLASVAGLFLTFVTYSGEASAANGGTYTLYSIAAVVLGGVSLFGGSGSAIGAIFGALMFRTIGDLLFVFNVEPLWQPLFQGIVLLVAVCLGSARPAARAQPASTCMADAARRRVDPAVAWAFGCIALVLAVGSLYSSSFLSPRTCCSSSRSRRSSASSRPAR